MQIVLLFKVILKVTALTTVLFMTTKYVPTALNMVPAAITDMSMQWIEEKGISFSIQSEAGIYKMIVMFNSTRMRDIT